jgi:hypothetical protein
MSRSEGGGGEESVGGDGNSVGGGGSVSDDVGPEALGAVRVDLSSV